MTMRPNWTAASGEAVPENFQYVMFPTHEDVRRHDAPDGARIGTLDRAVVNSQAEIEAGGWVRVLGAESDSWVKLSELAYLPPSGANVDYFAAYAKVYREQIERGSGRATLEITGQAERNAIITLRLAQEQDDDAQKYVYEVSQGRATPIKMYTIDGIAIGFAVAGVVMITMTAYGAAVIVYLIVRFLRRGAATRS